MADSVSVVQVSRAFPTAGEPRRAVFLKERCEALHGIDVASLVVSPGARGRMRPPSLAHDIAVCYPHPRWFPGRISQSIKRRFLADAVVGCVGKAGIHPFIVHAHFGPDGVYCLRVKDMLGLPLVTSFYGYDVSRTPNRNPGVYQELFRRGEAFTALSEDMKKDLIALGCPNEKIHVIHVGVDPDRFSPPERPDRGEVSFVSVARFEEKKGLRYAIAAFADVVGDYPMARLRLVGDGPLRGDLVGWVRRLGLEEHVSFINNYAAADPRGVILGELATADVYVLPSVTAADGNREGTPVTLMEAGAMALPSVSSRHAGIPEVVLDGETGLLVAERDVAGLSAAMGRLAGDATLRTSMGKAARGYIASEFNSATEARKLKELYESLIDR